MEEHNVNGGLGSLVVAEVPAGRAEFRPNAPGFWMVSACGGGRSRLAGVNTTVSGRRFRRRAGAEMC